MNIERIVKELNRLERIVDRENTVSDKNRINGKIHGILFTLKALGYEYDFDFDEDDHIVYTISGSCTK